MRFPPFFITPIDFGILRCTQYSFVFCLSFWVMLVGAPLWGVAWDELPSIFDLKQTYLDGLKYNFLCFKSSYMNVRYTFITGMVLWGLIAGFGCVAANSQDCRDRMMSCMAKIWKPITIHINGARLPSIVNIEDVFQTKFHCELMWNWQSSLMRFFKTRKTDVLNKKLIDVSK